MRHSTDTKQHLNFQSWSVAGVKWSLCSQHLSQPKHDSWGLDCCYGNCTPPPSPNPTPSTSSSDSRDAWKCPRLCASDLVPYVWWKVNFLLFCLWFKWDLLQMGSASVCTGERNSAGFVERVLGSLLDTKNQFTVLLMTILVKYSFKRLRVSRILNNKFPTKIYHFFYLSSYFKHEIMIFLHLFSLTVGLYVQICFKTKF